MVPAAVNAPPAHVTGPNQLQPTKPPLSLGWTAIDLFVASSSSSSSSTTLLLQEGAFKLPVSASPVTMVVKDPSWALPREKGEGNTNSNNNNNNNRDMYLFLRMTHAAASEAASHFPINPNTMAGIQ